MKRYLFLITGINQLINCGKGDAMMLWIGILYICNALIQLIKQCVRIFDFYGHAHFSWSMCLPLGVSSMVPRQCFLEDLDHMCNLFFVKVLHMLVIEMLIQAKTKSAYQCCPFLHLLCSSWNRRSTSCATLVTRSTSWKLQVNIICELLFYVLKHTAATQEKNKNLFLYSL